MVKPTRTAKFTARSKRCDSRSPSTAPAPPLRTLLREISALTALAGRSTTRSSRQPPAGRHTPS
eukprot:245748-Prymnesium_polylepis.1